LHHIGDVDALLPRRFLKHDSAIATEIQLEPTEYSGRSRHGRRDISDGSVAQRQMVG
jgi:hypothetical protein